MDTADWDCFFTLDLAASYAAGTLDLQFTVGALAEATWVNYLIILTPYPYPVPLWTVPLPVTDPPSLIPVSFTLPSMGWIGIWSALYSVQGQEVLVFEWVDAT